jgi:hypothetical protein
MFSQEPLRPKVGEVALGLPVGLLVHLTSAHVTLHLLIDGIRKVPPDIHTLSFAIRK